MTQNNSRHRSSFIAFSIIFAGFFCSLLIVHADDVSTSVTVGNSAPVISNLSLNGGNDITLTENSSVLATSTMTVTDANGCSEISSVTAKMHRSGVVSSCADDDESCYNAYGSCTATTTGNTCDGGSDTSVQYECTFRLWYTADPTDSGTYSGEIWTVSATSSDGTNSGVATNTAETIEVDSLNSLDVTASIAYGSVSPNSNTGSSNQTTTVTNTGNTAIDSEVSGDDMCTDYPGCAGDTFGQDQQKFDTSDSAYGSLSNTLAATTSAATIELDLAKPSATSSAVTDALYWGIAIPAGQAPGSYTGQDIFTAVSD